MSRSKNAGWRKLLRPTTWPPMMARSLSSFASFCVSNPITGVYGVPVRANKIAPAAEPPGRSGRPVQVALGRREEIPIAPALQVMRRAEQIPDRHGHVLAEEPFERRRALPRARVDEVRVEPEDARRGDLDAVRNARERVREGQGLQNVRVEL